MHGFEGLASFEPEAGSGGETDAGVEVAGEFVGSGCDGAEVLEAAEGALDGVTQLVGIGIEREAVHAVDLVGDHRKGSASGEIVAERVTIVGAVGEQAEDRKSTRLNSSH